MSLPDDIAIRLQGVGKNYHIYRTPADRLKQALFGRFKQYHSDFWALSDVTLDIPKGGCVGIIGRNGSGKSTLLQLITGVLPCSEGSIETSGKVAALLELGAGFNPEFTGRENVYLNGSLLGLSRAQVNERFDSIHAFSEIGNFIDQPVKTYSSGMFMRLAFAVVAHVDADILVIDEALAVGDAFFVQKCMRFLRGFKERGTLLFVSHDSGAIASMCDSAVWLHEGRMEMAGPARDVGEQYFNHRYTQEMGIDAPRRRAPRQSTGDLSVAHTPVDADGEGLHRARQVVRGIQQPDDPDAFGTGHASISAVTLTHADGRPIDWLEGSEPVTVTVHVTCERAINDPIVGFSVKDRLGQHLFGDNTTASATAPPPLVDAGHQLVVRFRFRMPLLATGEYTLTAAVASGTMEQHVQHQWVHDALVFQVHSPSLTGVLVGVPMQAIDMTVQSQASPVCS